MLTFYLHCKIPSCASSTAFVPILQGLRPGYSRSCLAPPWYAMFLFVCYVRRLVPCLSLANHCVSLIQIEVCSLLPKFCSASHIWCTMHQKIHRPPRYLVILDPPFPSPLSPLSCFVPPQKHCTTNASSFTYPKYPLTPLHKHTLGKLISLCSLSICQLGQLDLFLPFYCEELHTGK